MMKALLEIHTGNHRPIDIDKYELEYYDYSFNYWENALYSPISLNGAKKVRVYKSGYSSDQVLYHCDPELLKMLKGLSCTHSLVYKVNGKGRKRSFLVRCTTLTDDEKTIPEKELECSLIDNGIKLQHLPTGIAVSVNNPSLTKSDKEDLCYLIIKSKLEYLKKGGHLNDLTKIQWDFRKSHLPQISFNNNIDSISKTKILNFLKK